MCVRACVHACVRACVWDRTRRTHCEGPADLLQGRAATVRAPRPATLAPQAVRSEIHKLVGNSAGNATQVDLPTDVSDSDEEFDLDPELRKA
eukprot:180079-Chlamydomonas_euryale.AAC.1